MAPSLDEPACNGLVQCQTGEHCAIECAPHGTDSCIQSCHMTCIADTPCSMIDCGEGKQCVESCLRDCSGMPQFCQQSCDALVTPAACDALTTESDCAARSDCIAIHHGENCSCAQLNCSCQNEAGPFARCESAVAPN